MQTDDLITFLANSPATAPAPLLGRRLGPALGWSLAATILLMALLLGVRADLAQAARLPMFWAKLLAPMATAAAAFQLTRRLAVPGMRAAFAPWMLAALLALAWSGAALAILSAPAEARSAMLFGATWKTCTLNIFLLSLPTLAVSLRILRNLAPTRPATAGAAAGLLAGAAAAAVYALHCPEMEAPFLGTWYVFGIVAPGIVGALIGSRWLRW